MNISEVLQAIFTGVTGGASAIEQMIADLIREAPQDTLAAIEETHKRYAADDSTYPMKELAARSLDRYKLLSWRQIGGDHTASEYGAEFARIDPSFPSSVELIRVENWLNLIQENEFIRDHSRWDRENVYTREHAVIDWGDITAESECIASADNGIGYDQMSPIDRALAYVEYHGYEDDNGYRFDTLAHAMSAMIPASALWSPSEYTAEAPRFGNTCPVCGNEFFPIKAHTKDHTDFLLDTIVMPADMPLDDPMIVVMALMLLFIELKMITGRSYKIVDSSQIYYGAGLTIWDMDDAQPYGLHYDYDGIWRDYLKNQCNMTSTIYEPLTEERGLYRRFSQLRQEIITLVTAQIWGTTK